MSDLFAKPPEWHANRRLGIGGSDARSIMNGEWLNLWLVKTGRAEPEDLSGVLAVQMGHATESLNLMWFERQTGHVVSERQASITHPYFTFMRDTLDGFVSELNAIVQAKWSNPFSKIEDIEQWHMAQCHHEMIVRGCDLAFLSVLTGKPEHHIIEIARDEEYAAELLRREQDFWRHVELDEAPADPAAVAAPIKPVSYRSVNMSGSNAWAEHAGVWRENIVASKRCDKAAKELRELVEPDVREAFGHGVTITRNKAGSLLIKEHTNG